MLTSKEIALPAVVSPRHTTRRAAIILWASAILFADVSGTIVGRTSFVTAFFASIPLFLLGVSFTLLLAAIGRRVSTLSPWVAGPIILISLALVVAVMSVFDLYYYRWIALNVDSQWQSWATNLSPMRVSSLVTLYLWLFGLSFTLLWAIGLYDVSRINAFRAQAFEAASYKAEATALRLQLNPHFMVNTLNAIASLIATRRNAEAEEMTCRLADFLRPSLQADPTASVTLEEELETVEAYLEIERVRWGERLDVEIDLDDDAAEAAVPNFILQPLVENAVKYGVAPTRAGVEVSVRCAREEDRLLLQVVNRTTDGTPPLPPASRRKGGTSGVGLSNVRQRLAAVYGEEAALETQPLPDGYSAQIRLPFQPAGIA